uniref:RING-type domain-containing protein n=1 Tax=Micromonas pusilla TaxID=38833 RepID=A0A7S0D375_MICPS|mmetsp:Transcript_9544/g.39988  ORF Transcript_9544/g.39988 Transcript_9544/m.39988 type:complete len:148 (+) Transcript_9544:276-719(+)
MRVCCQTRSQVDGPELCTVCIEPLPLPGPGADVVLMLHACGHCFHRDCGQEVLLNALRKYEKPRCPNCRATLDTAPFGKLLGQRRQPRAKRMRNMRELISVSEEYMKSKNWRVPKRNAVGSSDAQRALAGLIIQSRKDFHDEFGEEA